MDIRIAALAALALTLGAPAAAQPPGALTGAVAKAAETVDAFHAALNRGDASVAAAMLDDEALIYEEGGAEESKAAYTNSHLLADIAFLATARETLVNRTGGASGPLAWVASQGKLQAQVHEQTIERDTTETMVLRRTGTGWRIVHVHWSSAKSPPPVSGR
jgi:ketosteroid isomerase-like protein